MQENRIQKADGMYDIFKNANYGDRLAICRTIQGKSQEDIAIEIILQQHDKGFDPLDENVLSICTGIYKKNILFNSALKLKSKKSLVYNNTSDFEKSYYEAIRKIESTRCKYKAWEKKNSINIDFSFRNLEILTSIYNCDYSFLLGDEIYPHRTTRQLVEETGLSPYTIEKLTLLTSKATQKEKSIYSYMLLAINRIISNGELLNILYRFFHIDFQDNNFDSLYPSKPEVIGYTYLYKIQYALQSLSEKSKKDNAKYPTFISNTHHEHTTSFGENLQKLIKDRNYTYTQLANEIYEYENNHGYNPPQVSSILRTINNWIKKTKTSEDYRINLRDLKALHNILNCSYEYLFGNCEAFNFSPQEISHTIGLTKSSINALKEYNELDNKIFENMPTFPDSYRLSVIDSLFTSDDLLLYLTVYLTDIDLEMFADELYSNSIIKEYYQFNNRLNVMENTTFLEKSDLKNGYFLFEILMELDRINEEYSAYYLRFT